MADRRKQAKQLMRGGRERLYTNIAFLLPAFLLMAIFIVYPILQSFYLSLFRWNGIDPVKEFIGLQNWVNLLGDSVFHNALKNNILIVIGSIIIQLPMGILIAIALTETKWFSRFMKTVFFMPMLMSSVAIGILFNYILDPNFGVIAAFAEMLGMASPNLLGDQGAALFTVILIICWQYTPFYMVLFLAAFATVSPDTKEYSQIDGATRLQYYWYIALPIIKSNVFTAMVLSLIGSLKYFDLIYVLTNGGPNHATELMATYMYKTAFTSRQMSYGSTIAMALFVIVMAFSIFTNWLPRYLSKRRDARCGQG